MTRVATGALVGALVLIGMGLTNAAASTPHRRHHHRAGCGTFCRQAGGLGGSPGRAPCRILNHQIREKNGVAPVTVRCRGKHTSRGAVVIWPHNPPPGFNDGVPPGSYNGLDLVVSPGKTVTFKIPLSRKALGLLAHRHKLAVDVLVELNTTPVQAVSKDNIVLRPA